MLKCASEKMRAKLGPASRAAMQFGATLMSRDIGTIPFTAPMSGVGRLAGKIGLTSARATVALLIPTTSAALVASAARRPVRIRIRVFKQGGVRGQDHGRARCSAGYLPPGRSPLRPAL